MNYLTLNRLSDRTACKGVRLAGSRSVDKRWVYFPNTEALRMNGVIV